VVLFFNLQAAQETRQQADCAFCVWPGHRVSHARRDAFLVLPILAAHVYVSLVHRGTMPWQLSYKQESFVASTAPGYSTDFPPPCLELRLIVAMVLDLSIPEQLETEYLIRNYSAKTIQAGIKRGFDLVAAAILLLLSSPLLCIVAILVRLQDGGPAIYKQRVVGPKGEFPAYKFRTMRVDADERLATDPDLKHIFERNFKLENDPRVTKLGSFLRKYSLDELPQLLNVVKGQMSLVGPRMLTEAELGKYGTVRELILRVKPGITGYWQVNGRQKVSYEERTRMDIYYIRNWSLMLDLYILCKTPFTVIKGEGAY